MRFHTPVCRTCNNGWMSTLEAEVQSLISPLVSTDFPCVAPMYFEELKRRGDRLAIWLAKTALTASLALPQAADPKSIFVPSEIKAGRISEGVRVDVAKAATAGETVALALSREFIVQSGNLPLSARHSLKTLQFSMQLNHLLLRIAISPDAIETPFPNSRGTAFRVYPRSSREVPACYEFPDFVAFINGVYLRTYNGVKYDRFMP